MHLKQEKTVLEIIHHFGSVDKMSKATGILRPSIYRYLKGQEITESVARRIEAKTSGKFNYKTLISLKTKYYLELEKFPDSLVEVPISHIIIPKKVPHFPDKKGLSASQQSACIDQNNHLIYGLEAIEACKKQGKKSVLAWRLSLSNLWNEKYEVAELVKTFDPVERSAIEIALKMHVGERRGRGNVGNLPTLKGIRSRDKTSELLGFNSNRTSRRLQQILMSNCCAELIYQLRDNKISVSKAAALANLPHDKQITQLSKIS